jgi:hypothetical protein
MATACSSVSATTSSTRASGFCSSTLHGRRGADIPRYPLIAATLGAQLIVRGKARHLPDRPRYVPRLALVEPSKYLPLPGRDPVEPA